MAKITFLGAGSTVFAKNIIGDCFCSEALCDCTVALYDIDPQRLEDSKLMIECLNKNINEGRATVEAYCGRENLAKALAGSNYIVNAIQVGGYDPCTITDFEIPKKYGLRQTIADTLGIGGIFRSLRTIPVMLDFAREIEKNCPDAWLLNYSNPMAMLTGAVQRASSVKAVGLCHSVQVCAPTLLRNVGMLDIEKEIQWKIAGINHQGWLLEITHNGKDLYPQIKEKAAANLEHVKSVGVKKLVEELKERDGEKDWAKSDIGHMCVDMVRTEIMLRFGYYITESSEHFSEYCSWFIRNTHPELIDIYNIPLDEYPRRCINQIEGWKKQRETLVTDPNLEHKRTHEYGSFIIEAMETDVPFRIGGNVLNTGLITNLPHDACVEVPCMIDRNGVQPCYIGDLPQQCAAMNRTNINVQLMTIEAALTGKKDYIYQAAMLDPLTTTNLSMDEIRNMCDDLIEAHGDWMPKFS